MPDDFAGAFFQAGQIAVRAQRIEPLSIDRRRRASAGILGILVWAPTLPMRDVQIVLPSPALRHWTNSSSILYCPEVDSVTDHCGCRVAIAEIVGLAR